MSPVRVSRYDTPLLCPTFWGHAPTDEADDPAVGTPTPTLPAAGTDRATRAVHPRSEVAERAPAPEHP